MGLAFIRVIQIGIKSLMLHKMRSLLTMLGIIFGVCSVIAMRPWRGASYEAQEAIRKLGSRNIIIRSVQPPKGQSAADSKRTYTATYGLKTNDVVHLMETVPYHRAYAGQTPVPIGGPPWPAQSGLHGVGTEPHHLQMSQGSTHQGRFLNENDERYRSNACVIRFPCAGIVSRRTLDGMVKFNNKDVFVVVGVIQETGSAQARALVAKIRLVRRWMPTFTSH